MSENTKSEEQIDPLLMELLCCPSCKKDSQLILNTEEQNLRCNKCSKEFAVQRVPGPDNSGILIPKLLL
jgi:hypothetical protein